MRKGFTLLELVVVIVVIGILAAIAIPTFAGVIERANEASANTSLDAFMADAKAIYAFDNTGAVGYNEAAFDAASLDFAGDIKAGTGPTATYTITVGGQAASVTALGVPTYA